MPVLYPDVETWAIGFLAARLSDPTIHVGILDNASKVKRVLVRRDGGATEGPVTESARIGINCYARTEQDAHALARLVRAHFTDAAGDGMVRRFDGATGPVYVPNPSGALYLFTVTLTVRGADL